MDHPRPCPTPGHLASVALEVPLDPEGVRRADLLGLVGARLGAHAAGIGLPSAGSDRAAAMAWHAVTAYLAALRGDAAQVDLHLGAIGATPEAGCPAEAAAQDHVEITTLGRFDAVTAAGPVRWPSRKARTLLQLLAVQRGAPVPRDVPAEVLWPGADRQRQRSRLAVVLSDLRRALDPERSHPLDRYVRTGQGSIWLDRDQVAVDLDGFDAVASAGLARWRAGCDAEARHLLERAAAACRGPLLPDAAYEDWTTSAREAARRTQGEVLRALVDLHRRAGDLTSARGAADALAALDPYDEAGHELLVEVLVAAGRHGEAQRARAVHRAALAELGVAAPVPLVV